MAHILVTGGAGFIGSSLASRLTESSEHTVVVADNLLTGFMKNVEERPNLTFHKADVNNFEEIAKVFEGQKFDYVFHYAAVVGVKRTLDNPIGVLDDIQGFKNVLDQAKDNGVKRVLYASSSEVYGEPVEIPLQEETSPLNARLPYAVVKNIGECYVRSYQQEFGLEYTIFRFFNTYGPRQSTDFVMSKFLTAALANEDITVYGDGSQSRTFGYIDDNLDATISAMIYPEAVNNTYNIGNDSPISVLELANKIISLTGSSSKIVHLPALKEGDMTRRQPEVTKMKRLLGRPFTSLDDGIKNVIAARASSE